MQRRVFLGGLAGLAAAGLAAPPALALTAGDAASLVTRVLAEIEGVAASGRAQSVMDAEYAGIFARYADVPAIASYVMGVDGRRASSAQKAAFQEAFTGYAARKYGRRAGDLVGATIKVNSVRKVKSFHEVQCSAQLRGAAPLAVNFMVSERGSALFFNLTVSGTNLLLNERTEIGTLIDRRQGDIDAMIADLRTAG